MGYLAVSVVTMVFNGMVLKWGETEGQNRLAVMSVNYLFASLGTASVWMVQGGGMPSPLTLLLGPLGGIFYGTGLFLWMVAIAKSGLGTSTAAMRISVIWPTLLSIVLFSEIPSLVQTAGIAFAILSIGMLASALTANQTVAFLGALFFLVLIRMATTQGAARIGEPYAQLLFALSIDLRLAAFTKGVIDTGDVTFFLAGAVWFLVLSVVAVESRRWR